jgi:hypothetical protein
MVRPLRRGGMRRKGARGLGLHLYARRARMQGAVSAGRALYDLVVKNDEYSRGDD